MASQLRFFLFDVGVEAMKNKGVYFEEGEEKVREETGMVATCKFEVNESTPPITCLSVKG